MSTIHIHPTVTCDPAAIFKLQRSTGLLVVIRGSSAKLVSAADADTARCFASPRVPRGFWIFNGSSDRTPPNGPEAA